MWIAVVSFELKKTIKNINHFWLLIINHSKPSIVSCSGTFWCFSLIPGTTIICRINFYAYSKRSIRRIWSINNFRTLHIWWALTNQNWVTSSIIWLSQLVLELITALRMQRVTVWTAYNILNQIIKPCGFILKGYKELLVSLFPCKCNILFRIKIKAPKILIVIRVALISLTKVIVCIIIWIRIGIAVRSHW